MPHGSHIQSAVIKSRSTINHPNCDSCCESVSGVLSFAADSHKSLSDGLTYTSIHQAPAMVLASMAIVSAAELALSLKVTFPILMVMLGSSIPAWGLLAEIPPLLIVAGPTTAGVKQALYYLDSSHLFTKTRHTVTRAIMDPVKQARGLVHAPITPRSSSLGRRFEQGLDACSCPRCYNCRVAHPAR